jgi:TetR/AcrR family transcriptional repressor of nem operon
MEVGVSDARHESKTKLLQAAMQVIRVKGYTATRIEDVCAQAGLTKGSFFHHFKTKEELAIATADYWSDVTGQFFAEADYHSHDDPRDRVLGYIDFRRAILTGDVPDFTCLVGTMVQEIHDTNPAIRAACDRSISDHAAELVADIAEAKRLYVPDASWTPESLALYTQAALQGAFILAKAKQSADVAADSIDHLRRYVELLFSAPYQKGSKS